ncbi:glycerol kinase GlpK [Gemmobacter serpentinus]|uniref:glycerol kinase GlpK n=1 Tax=Gemmobacter serpentinus TaxID=2652247 RepID=UPI00124EED9E|nr:glycerol kinase GlpK [Gemmobacter serpentinus]
MTRHILAIDQGTTSSRAILFDQTLRPIASAQQEFAQHFPASGWVEHDPGDLWSSVVQTVRQTLDRAGIGAAQVAGLGITNQRETTLLWDRATGQPLHRAIVWQDRRSAGICDDLRAGGHEALIAARTGLLLDPYFSGTKLKWLLDHIPDARARAARGELAFGTVDSWLIWNLTGGKVHATDATNAARTLIFDISRNAWDAEICALLDIPMALLPQVRDSADEFGVTEPDLFGAAIPIRGVAGDQQAATVGQACFRPGMMKSTYGTGCFALLNTGAARVASSNRLLTTVAYRLNGQSTYALEGSIFVAGAVVQWLRDGLGVIDNAGGTQALAESADPAQALVMVPAFTGLGAPYWRPDCRGAIYGLTRNSGPAEFARAALESVGHQTRDLLEAMQADWPGGAATALRVDGGMARSDWTMQYLADILGAPVDRPQVNETTALGAAYLAGLQAGLCPDPDTFAREWALERRFDPAMPAATRDSRHARWQRAVQATMLMGG